MQYWNIWMLSNFSIMHFFTLGDLSCAVISSYLMELILDFSHLNYPLMQINRINWQWVHSRQPCQQLIYQCIIHNFLPWNFSAVQVQPEENNETSIFKFMYYTFLIGRSKLTSLINHVNLKETKHVMLTGHSEFWKQMSSWNTRRQSIHNKIFIGLDTQQ
jgi:hypothetical protein